MEYDNFKQFLYSLGICKNLSSHFYNFHIQLILEIKILKFLRIYIFQFFREKVILDILLLYKIF